MSQEWFFELLLLDTLFFLKIARQMLSYVRVLINRYVCQRFYIERRAFIYIVSYLRRHGMKLGEFQHKLTFFLNKRQKQWFHLSSCTPFVVFAYCCINLVCYIPSSRRRVIFLLCAHTFLLFYMLKFSFKLLWQLT